MPFFGIAETDGVRVHFLSLLIRHLRRPSILRRIGVASCAIEINAKKFLIETPQLHDEETRVV